ncbi:uncharacterized protein EAF01_006502 [Botrytis porri]|uniref:Uncharacterized protein n=1 Tax=Botrytis porri TaxID=87229 RepID=A0A4Z1KKF1_9HELO|nr:uncharacterized protein EAF01_006502 [Botrytis porri]KAF7903453.1 hypothetical protein EAF01_006502 [Botrytis porri]TGO85960.1 hypothetical protein BPOR_0348g00050 [Botrytis porri]
MNTVLNLFPHPHTFFPSHSRQTSNISKPCHHVPGWYYRPDSASSPIKLSPDDVNSSPRRRQRQQRNSYDNSPSLSVNKGENTRSRKKNEADFSRRGRSEDFSKRYGEGNGIFAATRSSRKGIENKERDRKIQMEMEIQRKIDGIIELQDAISQEQDRIEDEWMFLERAWEVLGECRGMKMERERDFREWVLAERSLNGGSGRVGSNRSDRRYGGWNEGRWENTEPGRPDTRGLY